MLAEKIRYGFSLILSKLINLKRIGAQSAFKNILLIKLDEAGDMVYATPVFRLLKNNYPDAELTLWCKTQIAPLIKNNPFLHQVITAKPDANSRFDLIVDLRSNWQAIFFVFFNPPTKLLSRGTVRFRNKMKGKHPHELETNYQIIEPILHQKTNDIFPEVHYSTHDEYIAKAFLHKNNISQFAILHVSANSSLRKWPLDQFAALAQYLYIEKNLEIVFVGSNQDLQDIGSVQKSLNFETFSVAGEFSWSQYASLAKKADLFVGNESGPLHVAAAMRTQSVGLFGPGEPDIFYPPGENASFVHHVLPCNPCNQNRCVRPHNSCMQMISLAEVIEKIKR